VLNLKPNGLDKFGKTPSPIKHGALHYTSLYQQQTIDEHITNIFIYLKVELFQIKD